MKLTNIFSDFKNYRQYLALGTCLLALFLLLPSCVSDKFDPDVPNQNVTTQKLYLQFNVAMPTDKTRSETDEDGSSKDNPNTFPGEYNENVINNFDLYFCTYAETEDASGAVEGTETHQFTISAVQKIDFNDRSSKTSFIKTEVTPEQLLKLVGGEVKEVRIYVIANSPQTKVVYKDPMDVTSTGSDFSALTAKNDNLFKDEFSRFRTGGKNLPLVNHDYFKFNFENEDGDMKVSFREKLITFQAGFNPESAGQNNEDFSKAADWLQKFLDSRFENKTLELERMFARIDYAESGNVTGLLHVFPIVNEMDPAWEMGEDCPLFVQTVALQPFNIHSQSYFFRHTAMGDNNAADFTPAVEAEEEDPTITPEDAKLKGVKLFGTENGSEDDSYNWIVDVDANYKLKMAASETWIPSLTDGESTRTNYTDHFFNILKKDSPETGSFAQFENLTMEMDPTEISDLFEQAYSYSVSPKTYYPWRYVSENTLPSQNSMIRGLSTGVMFTVRLCDENGRALDIINSNADLKKPVTGDDGEQEDLYGGWISSVDNNGDGAIKLKIGENETTLKYETRTIGKTRYSGYFLTYYYFIRHNFDSSGNNRVKPQPMKFGVVRNNIYRICVAGFNGVPRPFDPNEPDEPLKETDIVVELDVLAWRQRNISVTF